MVQAYVASSKRRDFSLFEIADLTEDEAFWYFVKQRWPDLKVQTCPECGAVDEHYFRKTRKQWRCRHCSRNFTVTHGTPFADRKLSYKKMLMGIFLYTSSVKGISCVDMSAKIRVNVKTARMLVGKLRECLLRQRDISPLSGLVHVDGGHFGGKPRKSNQRRKPDVEAIADKVAHQFGDKKNKKSKPTKYAYASSPQNIERRKNRRIVMVMREVSSDRGVGGKRTIVSIAMAENSINAETLIRRYVRNETLIMSDENSAYTRLSQWYDHESVEHSKEFVREDGVNENQAESYFSRLRRYEYGIGHRITPKYLMDLANEFAWREDTRKLSEKERFDDIFKKIFRNGLSRWWRGYHQGHHRHKEILMA